MENSSVLKTVALDVILPVFVTLHCISISESIFIDMVVIFSTILPSLFVKDDSNTVHMEQHEMIVNNTTKQRYIKLESREKKVKHTQKYSF